MIRRLDPAARLVSLGVIAFGLYVIFEGTTLRIGQMSRIGPGFFPIMLGAAMTLMGVLALFERPEPGRGPFPWRGLVCVGFAILAFALLIRSAGLIPAVTALVLLTALAQPRPAPLPVLAMIGVLCAVGYFLFILGLRLPMELFVPPPWELR